MGCMIIPCMCPWTTEGLCHEFLNTCDTFNQIQQRISWRFHLPSALVETLARSHVLKKTNLWFELYSCSQTSFSCFISHQHMWKLPKTIHSSMASSERHFPPIWVVSVLWLVQRSCLWLFPVVLILREVLHWSFFISSDFAPIRAYR